MQNTLLFAEREFRGRARASERAAERALVLQSWDARGKPVAGLTSWVDTGARWLASLVQAAPQAVRWSIESRRPQEQCC